MTTLSTDIKPGWTTSEWWSTTLVHILSAVALVLTDLHVNWSHLTAVQASVPVVALIVSGAAQLLYANKRTALKIAKLQSDAAVIITHEKSLVTNVSNQLSPLVSAVTAYPTAFGTTVGTVVSDVEHVASLADAVIDTAKGEEVALGTGVHS
jgi:hypothetical protein